MYEETSVHEVELQSKDFKCSFGVLGTCPFWGAKHIFNFFICINYFVFPVHLCVCVFILERATGKMYKTALVFTQFSGQDVLIVQAC